LYLRGLLVQTKNFNYTSSLSPFLTKTPDAVPIVKIPLTLNPNEPHFRRQEIEVMVALYRLISNTALPNTLSKGSNLTLSTTSDLSLSYLTNHFILGERVSGSKVFEYKTFLNKESRYALRNLTKGAYFSTKTNLAMLSLPTNYNNVSNLENLIILMKQYRWILKNSLLTSEITPLTRASTASKAALGHNL
jgi:hypothetical protein